MQSLLELTEPMAADPLESINEEKLSELLPVLIYMIIMMVIGLLGNPLVIFFFGFYLPSRTSYMFITTLAVFDLMISCVAIPFGISFRIYNFYTFSNLPVCRLQDFINYFLNISSGLIVFAVAVERYKKIRKRSKTSLQVAKAVIIVICIMSFVLACPNLIFSHLSNVNVTETWNVTGHRCQMLLPDRYLYLLDVYHVFLLILFVVFVSTMTVLYCFIQRQVRSEHLTRSSHYTFVMICISVCYVLSYLPYLIIRLLRIVGVGDDGTLLVESLSRSYLINSAANPIIYGLLNAGFKEFLLSLLKKLCCCCKPRYHHSSINDDTAEAETRQLLK